MGKKVYVIIHSLWGHVNDLATSIAAGVKEEGLEVKVWQVPEILSEEALTKMHAKKLDLPVISEANLLEADAFLFGLPTRYGGQSAAMRAFLDTTGKHFSSGALAGKLAGVFTSTSTQHGGIETTALTFLPFLVHQGMIFVPFGFNHNLIYGADEVIGASPYGSGTIAAEGRVVSDREKSIAKAHGKQFSTVVKRFN